MTQNAELVTASRNYIKVYIFSGCILEKKSKTFCL